MLNYVNQTLEILNKHSGGITEFINETEYQFALAFGLMQIGEQVSTGKISREFQDEHSEITWAKINGMRNIVVHTYEGIEYTDAWGTLNDSLPELRTQLTTLLQKEDPDFND
ncbi:MAG: DUF86 domain-containing protein [Lactobacillaceae bacterium]|nr:DUF86 domain-containing protein [Lactobacillaceae bacterium]